MAAILVGLRLAARLRDSQPDEDKERRAQLGLGLFALTGAAWSDPVAGFVIALFAIHEGREAWQGELTEDDGE